MMIFNFNLHIRKVGIIRDPVRNCWCMRRAMEDGGIFFGSLSGVCKIREIGYFFVGFEKWHIKTNAVVERTKKIGSSVSYWFFADFIIMGDSPTPTSWRDTEKGENIAIDIFRKHYLYCVLFYK